MTRTKKLKATFIVSDYDSLFYILNISYQRKSFSLRFFESIICFAGLKTIDISRFSFNLIKNLEIHIDDIWFTPTDEIDYDPYTQNWISATNHLQTDYVFIIQTYQNDILVYGRAPSDKKFDFVRTLTNLKLNMEDVI